jgi:hypothetical protein
MQAINEHPEDDGRRGRAVAVLLAHRQHGVADEGDAGAGASLLAGVFQGRRERAVQRRQPIVACRSQRCRYYSHRLADAVGRPPVLVEPNGRRLRGRVVLAPGPVPQDG